MFVKKIFGKVYSVKNVLMFNRSSYHFWPCMRVTKFKLHYLAGGNCQMTCNAPKKCTHHCTAGNCSTVTCNAKSCSLSCTGGGCFMVCNREIENGQRCDQICTSGGCGMECHGQSCEQSCTRGVCQLACLRDASKCHQECTTNKDKCKVEFTGPDTTGDTTPAPKNTAPTTPVVPPVCLLFIVYFFVTTL